MPVNPAQQIYPITSLRADGFVLSDAPVPIMASRNYGVRGRG